MAGLRDRNLISNQFDYQRDQELTPEEASAACGPTAALAFARFTGHNPTIGQALALAKQVGWTPSLGMAGPESEVKLLGQLGTTSQYTAGASPDAVAQEVQAGRPVIVDTPNHYFAIDDYDPKSGAFHVGGSGQALRTGSDWMTWDQISQAGGGARGAIFVQGDQMASQKSQMQASGSMDAKAFAALVAEHGGLAGRVQDPTDATGAWTLTFNDHSSLKAVANDDGSYDVADWGTAGKATKAPAAPTTRMVDGYLEQYNPDTKKWEPAPGAPTSSANGSSKQVGTNTRDAYITTVDKDGNATTIPNPNYQPPASTVTAGSTDPYIISRKADGSLVSERNPNYVAPTQIGGVPIDDAIKTAQLLQSKLALQVEQGRLTNETAAQHFSQWWQINVDYPLKLHEARVAEVNAAQTASQNAQDIALRSLQYRVGPNFGADFARGNATLAGGGGKITYNPDDFTFDMPNFNQIGQQAASAVTAQFHPADKALAAISPTAAANVGAPPPNVAAIPAMAAAVPYVPPGAAPVAAPAPPPYVGSGMRDRG